MTPYAWKARLLPGSLEAYRKAHDEMTADFSDVLRLAGYRNYRIFAHRSGELFGAFECENIDRLHNILASHEISALWQAKMQGLIERDVDPETRSPRLMKLVFDLDKAAGC